MLPPQLHKSVEAPGMAAIEPSVVFAIKSLLYPVVAVACLLTCLLFWDESLNGPNFLVLVLTFVVVANAFGVTHIARLDGNPSLVRALIGIGPRWLLVIAFNYALLHVSRLTDYLNLKMYLVWAACTPAALLVAQIATRRVLALLRSKMVRPRRAAIVGLTDLGLRLEQHLKERLLLPIEVVGFFEDRCAARLPAQSVSRVLGPLSTLADFISRSEINIVYVTLPMSSSPRIVNLINALRDSTVSVYFVPDLHTFDLIQGRIDVIGGMPVVAVRESPFYGASSIAKRLSDIVVASTALILCAPVLAAVAVGVRWRSPGPVFFKQKRYGLDGREIVVIKFRSMNVTESGVKAHVAASREDPRITPFGAFIRKTSLDELPQLFNVLGGSMSIVGPRPHPVAMNEQYRRLIPDYMYRHKVKPGITGWAQVNGCRGGDDMESMQRRINYDIEYLRRWSLAFDASIIVKTALIVLRDQHAY